MNGRRVVVLLAVLLLGCDVLDRAAITKYDEATKRWNAGEYQQAVNQYLALVREHPSSARADDALYWAGVTQFLYLGETEKALQTFRLLLKRYPAREMAPPAQWYLAQIFDLGYNDWERAIEEYRKATAYADREVREKSQYSMADVLFRIGRREEARAVWLQQVKEFPNGPQSRLAYYRLGTAAFSRGDIRSAEQFYRKTLENNPDRELSIKASFALAGCYEADDRLADALALYKQIERSYANPEAIQIKIKALETRILKKSY